MNIERLNTPWWALRAGYTQLGGYVAAAWLLGIGVNLGGLFGGGAKVTA